MVVPSVDGAPKTSGDSDDDSLVPYILGDILELDSQDNELSSLTHEMARAETHVGAIEEMAKPFTQRPWLSGSLTYNQ